MKILQLLRLSALLLLALTPEFVSANKESGSFPIVLTIPNTVKTSTSSIIHVHANVGLPQGVQIRQFTPSAPKGIEEPISIRTTSARDGKVDVDIIIRTEYYSSKFQPFTNEPNVRIEVGIMSFITVDNISGVFQNGSDVGQNPANLQDVTVFINEDNDENQTGNNITNESSLNLGDFQLNEINSIQPVRNQFAEITLFPNPVNGSLLNIASKSEFDGITEIAIHNAIGNLVKKQNTNQNIGNTALQVDVDELSSGIYFLTISNASGKTVRKFTVTH
jgi:hypothetical protein